MQCKASKHPAWLCVNYVHIIITRTIAADFKRRDGIAELLLKPIL
jgi:hypothetical protein